MTLFVPDYRTVGHFTPQASTEVLLQQQGMYAADLDFAKTHSQPLMKSLLAAIPEWYLEVASSRGEELNIDTRVHELRKGQFPASPGWHVDAASREVAFDDHADKQDVAFSLVGTVSSNPSGVSNTVFCDTTVETDFSYEEAVADNCHLLASIVPDDVDVTQTSDGCWTLFDPSTIHRVQSARCDGTRLFVRVSMWKPPVGHVPGLTHLEQVYNSHPEERSFYDLLKR